MNRVAWKVVGWSFAILLFLILIVFPLLISVLIRWSSAMSPDANRHLMLAEQALSWVMFLFALVWVFFLGASFASFLNVVAWRIPRGNSILGSSCCPHCHQRIRFKDNIPVIGWLKSAGRCSMCGKSISLRYLAVEIVLGLLFVAVIAGGLMSGGITLPIRAPDRFLGLNRMFFEPKIELIQTVGWHLVLIMVLFTLALIEMDFLRIPVSIWRMSVLVGFTIGVIFPTTILVDWRFPFTGMQWPLSRLDAIKTTIVGLFFGWFWGLTSAWLSGAIRNFAPETEASGNLETRDATASANGRGVELAYGLSIVGLFLGWQSALVVGVFWTATTVMFPRLRSVSLTVLLSLTLLQLATWRWFNLLH